MEPSEHPDLITGENLGGGAGRKARLAVAYERDELIPLFARECAAHGGPTLDVEELRLHVRLFVALLGMARGAGRAPERAGLSAGSRSPDEAGRS